MKRLLSALLAFALPLAGLAQSVPAYISYQGKITDASGTPVGNTAPVNRTVIFRIWNSTTDTAAANRLYSEKQNVTISGGEFSVLIGAGTSVDGETANLYTTFSAAIFGGPTAVRFLGVTVDDGDLNLTNDPESSPRQQMVSTAFALRAQTAESVAIGGITSTALANDSVVAAALAVGAVTSTKLAASAVGTTALADTSVTSGKLATAAVGTTQLADGSVTGAKLAAGGIDATKLTDGSVTLAKHAANSIDSGKIVDGGVATADLANLAVDSTKLADGAVTLAKHASNSVDATKLVDSSVTLAKLASNSVDSSKIVDGSIALADLSTTVAAGLPKARHIYDQAKNTAVDSAGPALIPIDLGDLANDVDGGRLRFIAFHKTNRGSMLSSEMHLFLQQPGFTNAEPNIPTTTTWLIVHNVSYTTVANDTARLPPQTISSEGQLISSVNADWLRLYNYYPGSLRSGGSNAQNNANTDQGPAITLNVVSIQTGTNKLTITVDNPHAIQNGNAITLAGVTGSPSANSAFTGTGTPANTANTSGIVTFVDRTSFEVTLIGASGSYSGGTVSYVPKYNQFRVWAAVHQNVSARIIVSDR